MDHLSFAQMLGNYGEFVGAIAVVVTLAYLAAQNRQNTKAIEVSNLRSRTDRNIGHSRFAVSTPGLSAQLARPGGRQWWDTSRVQEEYESGFVAYIDQLL